ncbi:MAG TPA: hypothetical protein VHJ20_24360 [Polyangia bacterium]|nr:hypothetical protein [Polyangia bacterium]
MRWLKRSTCAGGIVIALAARTHASEVVQLPVDGVLDGRPVATLTGGVVVPWTTGLDADDGFMTAAAAASLHETGPALPDDGVFAANADHPEVRLHVSNAAAATSPQAHVLKTPGHVSFDVSPAVYEKVLLFLGSSYGDAPLVATLTYADGTKTTLNFTLPDWGVAVTLPKSPPMFYLAAGLHKWTKAGASVDTPSHSITGVAITPAQDRALVSIDLQKTTAAPWLVFWGATAIARDLVDAGVMADAAVDASTDGPAEGVDAGPDASAPVDVMPQGPPDVTSSDASVTSNDASSMITDASVDVSAPRSHPSSGCTVASSSPPSPFWLAALAAIARATRRRAGTASSSRRRSTS